jgi:hypothetical protein
VYDARALTTYRLSSAHCNTIRLFFLLLLSMTYVEIGTMQRRKLGCKYPMDDSFFPSITCSIFISMPQGWHEWWTYGSQCLFFILLCCTLCMGSLVKNVSFWRSVARAPLAAQAGCLSTSKLTQNFRFFSVVSKPMQPCPSSTYGCDQNAL